MFLSITTTSMTNKRRSVKPIAPAAILSTPQGQGRGHCLDAGLPLQNGVSTVPGVVYMGYVHFRHHLGCRREKKSLCGGESTHNFLRRTASVARCLRGGVQ
ncbi:hypothetical protein PC123_g5653 [Phytophthora cactorum]|nr:hypothetical protein PC120_g5527 [Phytophthora cactorum]KAG4059412.1 hypothetical protein PC123_g5653 [Phytophthora cactorum]